MNITIEFGRQRLMLKAESNYLIHLSFDAQEIISFAQLKNLMSFYNDLEPTDMVCINNKFVQKRDIRLIEATDQLTEEQREIRRERLNEEEKAKERKQYLEQKYIQFRNSYLNNKLGTGGWNPISYGTNRYLQIEVRKSFAKVYPTEAAELDNMPREEGD